MNEATPESFLRLIHGSNRGKLKIYLGYAPGVGKTYRMLQEAHELKARGIDVVVAVVETHGREGVARLGGGLEFVPRRDVDYRGIHLEEMDVEAVIARKPQVALVDELAHTNVPGSKNPKRYQDVQDILSSGIHVISTLNVQHFESLYNMVEKLVGVKVKERVPDSILVEADQVVNIDIAPTDLRTRLADGDIYTAASIAPAMENYFAETNLEQLRELALREIASHIDKKRRVLSVARSGEGDQVLVCLSSRGPNSALLLRYAARLAGRLNRNWYALYVQRPEESPTRVDSATQRVLSDTLALANNLGAIVFTFKGLDVVNTVVQFAREYGVGHIVMGMPRRKLFWRSIFGRSLVDRMIEAATGISVIVVDTRHALAGPASNSSGAGGLVVRDDLRLSRYIATSCIQVWHSAVPKEEVLSSLIAALCHTTQGMDAEDVRRRIEIREEQGATFLNEGVAIPHARIPGLTVPLVALGVTHGGLTDVTTDAPIRFVAMVLIPEIRSSTHIEILGRISRFARDRAAAARLSAAITSVEVVEILLEWEQRG